MRSIKRFMNTKKSFEMEPTKITSDPDFQRILARAKEQGYLDSNGKNVELSTWQLAALAEKIADLCRIFEKWELAAFLGGGQPNTYRTALRRARENNPQEGDFEKKLEKDFLI